jgi:hypothetical protein
MTNMKALIELLSSDIISQAEFDRFEKRVAKAAAAAEKAQLVADLAPQVEAFMVPGTQYKISDLVLGVMEIKAPCHGYAETAEERKFRDGVAKPRMIAALELLGADKIGTGAQTRYSLGQAEAAELTPVTES